MVLTSKEKVLLAIFDGYNKEPANMNEVSYERLLLSEEIFYDSIKKLQSDGLIENAILATGGERIMEAELGDVILTSAGLDYAHKLRIPIGRSTSYTPSKHQKASNPKVFISHSSKDAAYVKAIVDLLEGIGISGPDKIFCSSVLGYSIKSGENFLNCIKNELDQKIVTLFILSNNFYNSPICLCEMGATWVKNHKFFPILIPPFAFQEIKGVITESQALKLNEKHALYDCFKQLADFFNIELNYHVWERKCEEFLTKVHSLLECNPINDLPGLISSQSDKIYSTEHLLRDRELFKRICKILPPGGGNAMLFNPITAIRYYNFIDNPIPSSKFYGLEDFSTTALNPASYFFDSELESLRLQLVELINRFLNELENNFQHSETNKDIFYCISKEWANEHPEIIQALHELRHEIGSLYDEFIKLGTRKFAL